EPGDQALQDRYRQAVSVVRLRPRAVATQEKGSRWLPFFVGIRLLPARSGRREPAVEAVSLSRLAADPHRPAGSPPGPRWTDTLPPTGHRPGTGSGSRDRPERRFPVQAVDRRRRPT